MKRRQTEESYWSSGWEWPEIDRLTARLRSPWGVGGAAVPPPTERNFAQAASTRCQLS